MVYESWLARYDRFQERLDDIHIERQKEWEEFAAKPWLPLPTEPKDGPLPGTSMCDHIQEGSARLLIGLDERGIDVDEEMATSGPVAPEVTNSWFGRGPAYSVALRHTQTGRFHGGRPTVYDPDHSHMDYSDDETISVSSKPSDDTPMTQMTPRKKPRARLGYSSSNDTGEYRIILDGVSVTYSGDGDLDDLDYVNSSPTPATAYQPHRTGTRASGMINQTDNGPTTPSGEVVESDLARIGLEVSIREPKAGSTDFTSSPNSISGLQSSSRLSKSPLPLRAVSAAQVQSSTTSGVVDSEPQCQVDISTHGSAAAADSDWKISKRKRGITEYQDFCEPCLVDSKKCRGSMPPFNVPCTRCNNKGLSCKPNISLNR